MFLTKAELLVLSVEDWEMFEALVDYSYENILHSKADEHPVLFTESAVSLQDKLFEKVSTFQWNDKAKRERLTEIMFEKYQVPAYFLVKNAVLTA